MKVYTSFEEIDKDLKILRLKKDISKEEIKLNYNGLKEDLGFLSVVGKAANFVIKNVLALKLSKKLFK
ncbi:hypothetical protein JM658_02190 [Joostella atrarenae]|uniref:Glutaminyl-tRNA synthetase n=1 Tax=Joostella atrarenae TaxID=679257 RepID=A0ABS9IZU2_9FLAO|nr:DUF6327 family protein [Joostella atrarenae]MCF8713623.1 hypothetical protein [Joostella atrarenae]